MLTFVTQGAKAQKLSGYVTVIDGDTLKMGDRRLRLHCIDAPESHQECQNKMTEIYQCSHLETKHLRELIDEQNVICEVKETDRYGRAVANCFVQQINFNEQLVLEALGIASQKYSSDYILAAKVAKRNVAGLWSGLFVAPWYWRLGIRLGSCEKMAT